MGRCLTCKHWADSVYGSRTIAVDGIGTCKSPKLLQGYGINLEEIPPDGALVEDDEGWGIYVAAGFGCVNHEPKEKECPQTDA